EDAEVLVDLAESVLSLHLSACVEQLFEWSGIEHHAASVSKRLGPCVFGPGVSVEAPDALEQDVHRAEVRDQQIGVEVEALLHRLRRDHDRAGTARRILAEARLDRLVELAPVVVDEARVMKRR